MVVIGQAYQASAHQRAIEQIKALFGLFCGDGEQLLFCIGLPCQHLKLQAETDIGRGDALQRILVLLLYKGRTQRLVARNDAVQRSFQCVLIEAAAQTQTGWNVISRTATVQLCKEPQALLGKRQRQSLIARYRHDGLLAAAGSVRHYLSQCS
ncbi:hypothetical protein ALQ91_200091 [Pseudomonas syringae pv. syringae]|nr:hypothetical protein ALQ91_200091 [Pseudomonas syringae pv. syringae]